MGFRGGFAQGKQETALLVTHEIYSSTTPAGHSKTNRTKIQKEREVG